MAIFRTTAAAQPSASLLAATAVKFGIPYWSISMALNMIVTILIVGRLWLARKHIEDILGKGHGKMYTGILAMVIESAAPYAISSLILIILYGLKDTGFVLLIPTFCQVQVSTLVRSRNSSLTDLLCPVHLYRSDHRSSQQRKCMVSFHYEYWPTFRPNVCHAVRH